MTMKLNDKNSSFDTFYQGKNAQFHNLLGAQF